MSLISADNYEECPPRAEAVIHSLRAIGYDLGSAIADLVDNSIFADPALSISSTHGTTEILGLPSWMMG